MMELIRSYLRFLLRSSNQHGVHSPFVYELITRCFYDTSNHPSYQTLKDHRGYFLSDNSTIEVTDFGAGSRVFSSNKRKVSAIAKNAGISKKRQRLLFRLMRYLEVNQALEMGTSLGLATAAMALARPEMQIDTVEGCPETAQKARQGFQNFELKNIALHVSGFDEFIQNQRPGKKYDLIYLDGNHNKEHTLNYFHQLLHHIEPHSVIVLDDINWSQGMQQAWNQIKNHPQVRVTIDTFYWGLVFFRKEQAEQHFTIRL